LIPVAYEMTTINMDMFPGFKLVVKAVVEGFDIEIRADHLLLKNIPYVGANRQIEFGTLVSELTVAGDETVAPSTHVVMFSGDHPCNEDGSELAKIKHQSSQQELAPGLVIHHSFSSKPSNGYANYYEKMRTYAAILSAPARAIDPSVTAQGYSSVAANEEESPFKYMDTASSRADICVLARKLALAKIAIVAVGGTGAYILDLVAKTRAKEIHIFDGDAYLTHNAFRAPGAASLEELREKQGVFRNPLLQDAPRHRPT
jgi:hypothetical protein